jgi:Tfp pilus assembly protein PilV
MYKIRTRMKEKGMTIIEAMVWVSITSMILLAITQSVQYFYRSNSYAVEQASAVSSGQRGVSEMVRVIREAAYASDGAYPIVSMATSSFIFYADIDSDPFIERVRYFLSGGVLRRGIIDPAGDPPVYTGAEVVSTVSDNIRNVEKATDLFKYYDKNGVLMTDLTRIGEVRFIQATMIVNVNPNRLPNQFTLQSSAAMRNLK